MSSKVNMESIYYSKRKYGSFIISLLIHIIIILLTVLVYKERDRIFSGFPESAPFKQPAPVSVTYQSPRTNTASSTQNKTLQQAVAKKIPAALPKIKKKDTVIEDKQKALEALKAIAATKTQEVPKEPEKTDDIQETGIQEPDIQEPDSFSQQKPKMTGSQLLKAFLAVGKHSTSTESNDYSQSHYGNSENYNGNGDDPYGYVNQRLSEFKYASYNTKVNEVLERAFNSRYHSIYFSEDIVSSVIISIIIKKDGKVKEAKLEKATGYEPLDSYILSVIKNVSFAPIPDHLNTEFYHFTHKAGVTMNKGQAGTIIYRHG